MALFNALASSNDEYRPGLFLFTYKAYILVYRLYNIVDYKLF